MISAGRRRRAVSRIERRDEGPNRSVERGQEAARLEPAVCDGGRGDGSEGGAAGAGEVAANAGRAPPWGPRGPRARETRIPYLSCRW